MFSIFSRQFFILLFVFFFKLSLYAEVKEYFSEKQCNVGDSIEFRVDYQNTDIKDWKLPEKGFLYGKEGDKKADLPYGKIEEISKENNSLRIRIRFLQKGEFTLPLSWQDSKGDWNPSFAKIKVYSNLKGDEKKLLDIKDPVFFRGPVLLRILLIFLISTILVGTIVYVIYYFSKKYNAGPKDAIIESPPIYEPIYLYKDKIWSLLEETPIYRKDFLYILSGFIKEKIHNKYQIQVEHLTFHEMEDIFKRKYRMNSEEIKKIINFFDSLKYMPDDTILKKQDAESMLSHWDSLLL
ncbi:MAG: hypothetical protein H7A25_21575 [Leptospiraceae bacterium]|nr:hypothetical protein [Leptospiraceae bacterium]MCP5502503.1 hypothetical protein [Leptospiraceae bacterium]